mmetsp:Transcript_42296/g.59204  ORF Transcript_42296/g.59204 Transcript_42296/m.59204 type:complete len:134 (+) Transcript_42296:2211-2612(+)
MLTIKNDNILKFNAFPNTRTNDSCIQDNIHLSPSFQNTATGEKVPTKLEGNGVIESDGNSLEIGRTKILENIPFYLLSVGAICDQLDATIVFDKDGAKTLPIWNTSTFLVLLLDQVEHIKCFSHPPNQTLLLV